MRFYLFICVLFSFINTASAQFARFLPGEIIFKSGEKKVGYIEKTISEKITYEVHLKANKKEQKGVFYTVDQVKSFQFKDGLKFVTEEITYATDAEGKEHVTELAFLEELESGDISLLEFDNQTYRGLFLKKKDGTLELLAQQEQACSDYMSILREEMADCDEVIVKDAMWFNARIITSLIEDYNSCGMVKKKADNKVVKTKNKSKWEENLGMHNGFSYNFLLSGQVEGSYNTSLRNSQASGLGLRADIRVGESKIYKHFIVQMGVMRHKGYFQPSKDSPELTKFNYNRVLAGLRTKFSVKSSIYPIFSIGFNAIVEQDNEEFRSLTRQSGYRAYNPRFALGFQHIKNGNILEFEVGQSNNIFVSLTYGRAF